MRDLETKKLVYTREALQPLLFNLLSNLNTLITESEGLDQYALKSLFRIVSVAKDDFEQYATALASAIEIFVDS